MTDIFGKAPPEPTLARLNLAAAALDKASAGREQRDPAFQEILRICSLPLITECAPEEIEAFNEENVLAVPFAEGWRLKPQQVEALIAYDMYDGAFLPLRVGAGKSLIALMWASSRFRMGLPGSYPNHF